MINALDFFTTSVSFSVEKTDKIQTKFGGAITVFLGILFGVLVAGFGQDFFKRENPRFLKSDFYLSEVPLHNITNQNFTLSFSFQNSDYELIDDDTFVYFKMSHDSYILNEHGVYEYHPTDIPIKKCQRENLIEGHFYKDYDTTNLNCPILDGLDVGGSWTQPAVSDISLKGFFCPEGSLSPSGKLCKTEKEKEEMFKKNYFLEFNYQKIFIDVNNYEEGVKQIKGKRYFIIDKEIFKRYEFEIKEISLTTDYGWLVVDKVKETFLSIDNVLQDFVSVETRENSNLFEKNCFAQIVFFMINDKTEYFREYVKIQTLAANVGGIIKIFIIVGYLIVNYNNKNSLKLRLENFFNKINEERMSKNKKDSPFQISEISNLRNQDNKENNKPENSLQFMNPQSNNINNRIDNIQYSILNNEKKDNEIILKENETNKEVKKNDYENTQEKAQKDSNTVDEDKFSNLIQLNDSKKLIKLMFSIAHKLEEADKVSIVPIIDNKEKLLSSSYLLKDSIYLGFYKILCLKSESHKRFKNLLLNYSEHLDLERYLKKMILLDDAQEFLSSSIKN